MKIVKVLFILVLALSLLIGVPAVSRASVMMTAVVNQLGFDILPTAVFTVDDWLSNPNLWTVTIFNTAEGNKTVNRLVINFTVSNPVYGDIVVGSIRVIGESSRYFRPSLLPGESYTVTNTMLNEQSDQVSTTGWSSAFVDESMRIGYLPEGTYTLSFAIDSEGSWYGDRNDPVEMEVIEEIIEIKNPEPPELITPEDNDDNVPDIPRFAWQEPQVTDLSQLKSVERTIGVTYTARLWKMFEDDGTTLAEEDAIVRVPIWEIEGLTSPAVDFDPGSSREELLSGRSYCWQVQAFDGTGRAVSITNDGKSDVWQFTIQFTSLVINEPVMFFPLRFTWTPAQGGSGVVLYDVFVADDPDFSGAYIERGLVTTSFTYPGNAPALNFGVNYSIKVQATDDSGIPMGEPVQMTITLPSIEVILSAPEDGAQSPTMTPAFQWQGDTEYYIVDLSESEGDWSYTSTAIQGTNWTYDGDELTYGATYSWFVSPADEFGDPVGESSESWTFIIPPEDQLTLISPVNTRIETVFPVFSWNRYAPATGDNVEYRLIIRDDDGNTIHTEDVSSTTFTYPSSAQGLSYAARYNWSVVALIGGDEVGVRSEEAWLITPFVETEGEGVTITEVEEAIKLVLRDYPQFEDFLEKILSGIQGEGGPITPGQLLEIIDKYKIVNVTVK